MKTIQVCIAHARFILCGLGVIALLGATTKARANTHGIIAGLGLEWYGSGNGSNANAIYINEGNGYIDGTVFLYGSSTSYAVPGGMGGGVTLSASTAYYIYIVCASSPFPFLSTVVPSSDGHPVSNLSDANTCGSNSNDAHGVFVGSILTDTNGDIVPFARNGDQVRLMPETGTTVGLAQGSWSVPSGSGICTGGAISFGELPASASAIVVQADTSNDEASYFGILQPSIACSSSGGLTWNLQYKLAPGLVVQDLIVKTGSGGSVKVAISGAGDTNDELTLRFYGYVEPVGHLVF